MKKNDNFKAMLRFENSEEAYEWLRKQGVDEERIKSMLIEMACLSARYMNLETYLRICGFGDAVDAELEKREKAAKKITKNKVK